MRHSDGARALGSARVRHVRAASDDNKRCARNEKRQLRGPREATLSPGQARFSPLDVSLLNGVVCPLITLLDVLSPFFNMAARL